MISREISKRIIFERLEALRRLGFDAVDVKAGAFDADPFSGKANDSLGNWGTFGIVEKINFPSFRSAKSAGDFFDKNTIAIRIGGALEGRGHRPTGHDGKFKSQMVNDETEADDGKNALCPAQESTRSRLVIRRCFIWEA